MSYIERAAEKNAAFVCRFPMLSASSPESLITGETVTVTARYADGATESETSFTPANAVVESGITGVYRILLTAAEMNRDFIVMKLTSTNAQDQTVIISTWDRTTEYNAIADFILRRNTSNVESTTETALDAQAGKSLYGMIAKNTHALSRVVNDMKITESDDTTQVSLQAITEDASANPISGLGGAT